MYKEKLVISPVYNEEKTIAEFYQNLRRYYSEDILFVDDGSSDKSKYFLSHIKNKNTFLIRHSKREGYGAALISGFKFALKNNYNKIVTIDADLQHNPQHLERFFRELNEYSVVLGSRYIKINKSLDVPRTRLIINRYISGLIKVLFSISFSDPFCGYRGYCASFLRRIYLKEKSYGLSLEILMELIRIKVPFKEIPVEAIYFNNLRKFLDGLDDPSRRLLYYLDIISQKRKEIENEKKIFICKSSS
jgi:dolichol-phosphate mannosyltransferase